MPIPHCLLLIAFPLLPGRRLGGLGVLRGLSAFAKASADRVWFSLVQTAKVPVDRKAPKGLTC